MRYSCFNQYHFISTILLWYIHVRPPKLATRLLLANPVSELIEGCWRISRHIWPSVTPTGRGDCRCWTLAYRMRRAQNSSMSSVCQIFALRGHPRYGNGSKPLHNGVEMSAVIQWLYFVMKVDEISTEFSDCIDPTFAFHSSFYVLGYLKLINLSSGLSPFR